MIEIPRFVDWIVWGLLTLFVMLWPGSTQAQTEETTELPAGVRMLGTVRMLSEFPVYESHFPMLTVLPTLSADVELDNAAYMDRLRQIPSVTDVMGGLNIFVFVQFADGTEDMALLGAYTTPYEAVTIEPLYLVEGHYPRAGKNEVAIERRRAQRLGLHLGDSLHLRGLFRVENVDEVDWGDPWTISGIVAHPASMVGEIAFYGTLEDAQDLNPLPGLNIITARFVDYATAEQQADHFVAVIDEETPYRAGMPYLTDPAHNPLFTFTNTLPENHFVAVGLDAELSDTIIVHVGEYITPGQPQILVSEAMAYKGLYAVSDTVTISHPSYATVSQDYTIAGVFEIPALLSASENALLDAYLNVGTFDILIGVLESHPRDLVLDLLLQDERVESVEFGLDDAIGRFNGYTPDFPFEDLPIPFLIGVFGYDVESATPAFDLTIIDGQPLNAENAPTGVIVSSTLAENTGVRVGDTAIMQRVFAEQVEATVVGIALYPFDQVWLDWRVLAAIEDGFPTDVYYINTILDNPDQQTIDSIKADLEQRLSAQGISASDFHTLVDPQVYDRLRFNFLQDGDIPPDIIGMYWEELEVLIRP